MQFTLRFFWLKTSCNSFWDSWQKENGLYVTPQSVCSLEIVKTCIPGPILCGKGPPQFLKKWTFYFFWSVTVKHGRGTRGAAPASDAATCEGRRCPRVWPRPAASCHVAFIFLKPTRTDAAPNRVDSRGIEPIRAGIGCIGRNRRNGRFRPKFKKKKRCKTNRLN